VPWGAQARDRLDDLAAELARLKVDVLIAEGTIGTLTAKRATSTIPIVMVYVADPVGSGLVASLAHPGGNVTELSVLSP
jgi:putative ABC transport system substrate-binding protein